MYNAFLLALQFLSRLPVYARLDVSPAALGRSALCYPLIGLLLGALLALLAPPLDGLDHGVAAALLLVVWVGFSGALHLDGFADTVDAYIGGGGDRARSLDLFKDARSGPMAVVAVVLLLLLKYALLVALLARGLHAPLLLAPLLGRAALLWQLLAVPCARRDGLAAAVAAQLPPTQARGVLAACVLGALLLVPGSLLPLVALVAFLFVWKRRLRAWLGGGTGDTCGAGCELAEVVVLLAALLAASG